MKSKYTKYMKKDFKIKEFFEKRPLSWSAISSFEYNPAEWHTRYILNEKQAENMAMKFGKVFAKSCEDGKPLAPVTLLRKMEHKFEVVFNGIKMVGYADTFDDVTFTDLGEYKTSKNIWTQAKVDQHGQLTMYCLFNLIQNKIQPEQMNIFLECLQTKESKDFKLQFMDPLKVHHFKTKRTMADVLAFGARINKVVKEMEKYAQSYPQ